MVEIVKSLIKPAKSLIKGVKIKPDKPPEMIDMLNRNCLACNEGTYVKDDSVTGIRDQVRCPMCFHIYPRKDFKSQHQN